MVFGTENIDTYCVVKGKFILLFTKNFQEKFSEWVAKSPLIEYNKSEPKAPCSGTKSCTPAGEDKYQHIQILGRVSRPHQGDTVSPRRGLKFPAAI